MAKLVQSVKLRRGRSYLRKIANAAVSVFSVTLWQQGEPGAMTWGSTLSSDFLLRQEIDLAHIPVGRIKRSGSGIAAGNTDKTQSGSGSLTLLRATG